MGEGADVGVLREVARDPRGTPTTVGRVTAASPSNATGTRGGSLPLTASSSRSMPGRERDARTTESGLDRTRASTPSTSPYEVTVNSPASARDCASPLRIKGWWCATVTFSMGSPERSI
ncbi:hypothetical protein [Streptomyces spectabilis]|uniref:hypothetical protein n=1 Tax=Streptomyces spectabilis TaxID=68270 RepID=UPI001FCFF591|nr:hypothetical protein [Streptomyces spectabilis]